MLTKQQIALRIERIDRALNDPEGLHPDDRAKYVREKNELQSIVVFATSPREIIDVADVAGFY